MNDTLIQNFNQVRDIPYRIPLSVHEKDDCCSGKMIQMKALLEKEGFESRYRVCEFHWGDFSLPQDLLNVPHDDVSTHVYLEVLIDGLWIKIDPTWDNRLKNIFPISEWDGEHDTSIAVNPIVIYDLEKSREIMEYSSHDLIEEDLVKNGEFYKAFNEWLGDSRVS